MNSNVFIWTEAFNCGELLTPFLSSYLEHHNVPINVFGTKDDLDMIDINSELIRKCPLFDSGRKNISRLEGRIIEGYKRAHVGTSILWAHLIKTRTEQFLMHIDADTIFVGDMISLFLENNRYECYQLMGSRRPYLNRTYRKKGIDSALLNRRPDAINTDCFMFDRLYVSTWHTGLLERKIQGKRTSMAPVVDFFDPVSFEIMKKGGEVCFMDSPNWGLQGTTNLESPFFERRINFAAVGSGINFYKNPTVSVAEGYRQFALSSYATYAKYILDLDIGIVPHNDNVLNSKLERLDKRNWQLK